MKMALLIRSSIIWMTVVTLTVTASNRNKSNVARSFRVEEIVPDVIPKAPDGFAEVVYPSGAEVGLGNELTPTQVKDIPTVKWDYSDCEYYAVLMIDPDAPSRVDPSAREWLHWLVGNIQGHDVASGEVIAEYVGAGPPPGSGLHRYVFLVYEQPGFLNFDEPRLNNTSAYKRPKFSVSEFAAKYNLGDPIAGSFFQAKYDDYVPLLHKQLNV